MFVHLVRTPSPVPAPRLFTYGKERNTQSPPHDSSEEKVTPKGNPMSRNNLPNPVLNLTADPYYIQFLQTFLHQIHLTHQTMSIIKEDDAQ